LDAAHKPVKAERDAYKRQAERLAAENAKLREERDHWRVEQVHAYGNWEDTYKRASELEAENAKLRELVRISIAYCNTGTCDECPIQSDDGSCPYAEMALKLGVEVPE
jgi:hypothetical protein